MRQKLGSQAQVVKLGPETDYGLFAASEPGSKSGVWLDLDLQIEDYRGAGKQGKTCFSGLGSDPLMLALGNSPLRMEAGGGRLHLHTLPSPQKKSKTRAKGSFQGSWRFGCASL